MARAIPGRPALEWKLRRRSNWPPLQSSTLPVYEFSRLDVESNGWARFVFDGDRPGRATRGDSTRLGGHKPERAAGWLILIKTSRRDDLSVQEGRGSLLRDSGGSSAPLANDADASDDQDL